MIIKVNKIDLMIVFKRNDLPVIISEHIGLVVRMSVSGYRG